VAGKISERTVYFPSLEGSGVGSLLTERMQESNYELADKSAKVWDPFTVDQIAGSGKDAMDTLEL
jgi:hypothetical protein